MHFQADPVGALLRTPVLSGFALFSFRRGQKGSFPFRYLFIYLFNLIFINYFEMCEQDEKLCGHRLRLPVAFVSLTPVSDRWCPMHRVFCQAAFASQCRSSPHEASSPSTRACYSSI